MTKKITSNVVTSLPGDMLAEILKHAASNSVTDFVNIGLSCKTFQGASNYDNQIFKHVSMKKYNFVPWRKSERVFQKKCEVAKNVEALYRKGMIDYFSRRKSESGLHCLKKAAEKGHVDAIYIYGIILMCLGGEQREQGLQLVSLLEHADSSKRNLKIIIGCRLKTKKFLSSMWVNVALIKPERIGCKCNQDIKERSTSRSNCLSPWEGQAWEANNNIGHGCDSCFWNREATLLCSLLRNDLNN